MGGKMNKEYYHNYYLKNKEALNNKNKIYQNKNSEKIKEYQKEYCLNNKEKKKVYDVEYRLNNKEKLKEQRKIYQKTIPTHIRTEHNRKYRQKNKKKYNQWQLEYIRKNKQRFIYKSVLTNFISRFMIKKINSTSEMLGYDAKKFKERIECQFKNGMSWNNYGKWQIDHKKPVSLFNLNTPPHIVNALCNLQPMWAKDNLKKGNKFKNHAETCT